MSGWPDAPIALDALPERCLVDTGVLIRALRQRRDDETPACVAFFDAMVSSHGKRMLIAAPTVAEMLRGSSRPLLRTRSLLVVPFDLEAAELLER